MSYILALTAFINVRIFEAAALYIYITNFTEHSVHTRRIDTHWHSSSIMLPQDHFNDVIAQWEVNRNIFMVHLRRRILNLPTLRFQLRAIKIATKKRLLMLKEPLEAMARKDGAEGYTYIERDRDTQGGVFIKSPVKRNGINSEKYFCIIRDIPTRVCICIMRRIIRSTSIYFRNKFAK